MDTPQPISAEQLVAPLEMPKADKVAPISSATADSANAAPTPEPTKQVPPNSPKADIKGRPWDPEKHAFPPRLTKTGIWIGKGAGRPSTKKENTPTAPQADIGQSEVIGETEEIGTETPHEISSREAQIRSTSQMFVGLFYAAGVGLLGEDMKPDDEAEHNQLVSATEAYLRTKPDIDLPPGLALSIAVGGYVLKRTSRPTVSQRLGLFWGKVKAKLGW